MTREEAIKLLVNATYSDEWQGNEDLTTAHNMAIKALEQGSFTIKVEFDEDRLKELVDEAFEEVWLKWIPCSEGLPKKTGKYIVTVGINRFGCGMFDEVSVATYNIKTGWFVRDSKDTIIGEVTAWMPLPELYVEGEVKE